LCWLARRPPGVVASSDTMTDEATGFEDIVVAEGVDGSPEFRTTVESEPPTLSGLKARGWGTDLKTPAWDDVRDRLDPTDFELGARVATIHYDLDAWEYRVEYQVDRTVVERLQALAGWSR